MTAKFEIGQELYLVPTQRRGRNITAKVTKIGRNWVTLDYPEYRPYRFDPETMYVDGGDYMPPFTVHLSESDYEHHVILQEAWASFRRSVEGLRTPNTPEITLENIKQAAKLLGLDLKES